MTIDPAFRRHLSVIALWTGSLASLGCSAVLMRAHAEVLQAVRTTSVPLAQEVPLLERRLDILRQQSELSQLHDALRTGSPEERIRVYALPRKTDIDRLVLTFDLLRDWLEDQGALRRMSALAFGDAREGEDVQDVTVAFDLRADGVRLLAAFLRLSGLVTVGDALTPDERRLLLGQTEAENPSGIVAVEQFLSTDLLDYARKPAAYEERLLQAFSSTTFLETLRGLTRSSLLGSAQRVLQGPMGFGMERGRLWPMQLMTVQTMSVVPSGEAEWYAVELVLRAHLRE